MVRQSAEVQVIRAVYYYYILYHLGPDQYEQCFLSAISLSAESESTRQAHIEIAFGTLVGFVPRRSDLQFTSLKNVIHKP